MRTLDEWRILRSRLLHGKGKAQKADARPSVPLAGNAIAKARPDDVVRWVTGQRGILEKYAGAGFYGAGALALVGAIGTGAWLLAPPAVSTNLKTEPRLADPSPRLEQITAAVRAPLRSAEEEMARAPRFPGIVIDAASLSIETGQRGKLPAHVDNEDVLVPETVVLVGGLPTEAELTEGIRIGPKLWMLRPSLLSTVEIDAGRSPAGRHDLTVELRTPEGAVAASAQAALEITPGQASVDAQVTPSAAVIETSTGSEPKIVSADDRPQARKPAKRKERHAAPVVEPVEVLRPKTKAKKQQAAAASNEPIDTRKETRARRGASQSGTQVLSSGPTVSSERSGQRMVWPGDDPRASYTQSNPVFLGGPDVQPRSTPPVEPEDANWRKRAFGY